MTGTIVTDGSVGLLNNSNLLSWDILVREQTDDIFTQSNSVLGPDVSMFAADSNSLRIANPGGYLEFLKTAMGGHKHSIQLADFVDGNNQAGYFFGSLTTEILSPLSSQSSYVVASAIPEPCSGILLLGMLAALSQYRRRGCATSADKLIQAGTQ